MAKKTTIQGLKVANPQYGGFVRVVDGPKWTLASIGHSEKYDEAHFTTNARHLQTDEAFILLAGFDDLKVAQTATPQLTTIHQPCEELARVAFNRLLERMAKPTLPRQDIFVESYLVVRNSTDRKSKGCRRK